MFKKIAYFLLFLLLLLAVTLGYFYYQYQAFLKRPVFDELPVSIVINKGDSYQDFFSHVNQLNNKNEQWQWKVLGRLHKAHRFIKAGEYEIVSELTPLLLLNKLDKNQVKTYEVTLVEGMQWKEVRELLVNHLVLNDSLSGMSDADVIGALGINSNSLEGQFLPETYQFRKGDTDFSILQRAHNSLNDYLMKVWDARPVDLYFNTSYELLIMASIIEKETALNAERNKVSGVFHRRLKKNMRLQTDPTVIYGLGDQYKGNITRKHLQTDTPYNTYTRFGLPPTPIALASATSISAAAHPDKGTALYFVADGKGGHRFSDTYSDHQKAVKNYLKALKAQKNRTSSGETK